MHVATYTYIATSLYIWMHIHIICIDALNYIHAHIAASYTRVLANCDVYHLKHWS